MQVLKQLARSHLKVLLIYLAAVTLLRFEIPGSVREVFQYVGLWIGGVIGMGLLDLDRLIHVYVERPQEQLSQQVQQHVKNQQWKGAVETLVLRRKEQYHLAFRNGVFGFVFIPVVFFAFTSASGMFGKGLVAGVMVHFLYDAWRDYLKDRERFRSWFFWMVQREFPVREQKLALYGLTGVFGFLSLLLL